MDKIIDPIDRHVGSRVRMRRMLMGISQEKLGEALGLTFQQIQKYEKGSNRISASRLQVIANTLQVPIPFFFENAPAGDPPGDSFPGREMVADVSAFLTTSEGLQVVKAFTRIKSGRVRRRIIDLVEALGEEQPEAGAFPTAGASLDGGSTALPRS